MSTHNHVVTVSAVVAMVLAVTPILADSGSGSSDRGVLIRYQHIDELLAAARSRNLVLSHEDFENSMARFLNQMEFAACTEPVSSASDDACFAPGDLVDGFSIRSSHLKGVLSQGIDILSVDSMTIGAWPYQSSPSSLNYTRVEFDHGPTLVAADVYGFQLAPGIPTGDPVSVVVEAFGLDGKSLGSFEVLPSAYNLPAFAGFQSSVPIAAVEFGTRAMNAGEQIDNLYFGGGAGRPVLQHRQLDFGAVGAGAVAVQSLQIDNGGSLPLSLGVPQVSGGPFAVEDEDCSQAALPAGASCTVWISFQPGYRDDYRARLNIDGDHSQTPTQVRLSGTGIDSIGGGQ